MDKEAKLQVLKDLIAINSANGNEIEVAEYLQKLLAKHGIEAKIDAFGDKRANLTFELGEGKQILGITGHLDTVALGDLSEWKHDPLTATVEGDKLYGRGAADMKSGLAAQIIALIELHEAGKVPGHLRFIGTAGEEYGTPGADRLEANGIAKDLSALLVGEPSSGNVIFAHSGCYNYRIVSKGQSVHASEPERGLNALDSLIDYCVAERNLFADAPEDKDLGVVKHSVTIIKGGEQINTIPDAAELRGNIRPTNAFNNDQVTARIKAAVAKINAKGKAQLTFSIIHDWWPVASDKDSDFIQETLKAAQAAYADYPEHSKPKLATMNGATDASVFVKHHQGLPVIVLGADEWSVAHQINEFTTISSYLATIAAYKNAIQSYFA
jgi:succinyl-diaminopimelate desuccinylase